MRQPCGRCAHAINEDCCEEQCPQFEEEKEFVTSEKLMDAISDDWEKCKLKIAALEAELSKWKDKVYNINEVAILAMEVKDEYIKMNTALEAELADAERKKIDAVTSACEKLSAHLGKEHQAELAEWKDYFVTEKRITESLGKTNQEICNQLAVANAETERMSKALDAACYSIYAHYENGETWTQNEWREHFLAEADNRE